ncbi:MAG: transposase family protein [Brachymonas sp.]|nr:transposase family protein [Brachymonas sp.]
MVIPVLLLPLLVSTFTFILALVFVWYRLRGRFEAAAQRFVRGRAFATVNDDEIGAITRTTLMRKKPDWVLREVLRLKALMGRHAGCRKISITFNRLHAPLSVGKTYVAEVIRAHQYLLMQIKRELRDKTPLPVSVNAVWGMDLTLLKDEHRKHHVCLGILDHGSRVCARLAVLTNKRAWTILGHFCLAIGKFGKPSAIRTDNEIVFQSYVFRTFLKLTGIKRQVIPTCSPWCNGRIEKFFGTIKPWLTAVIIPNSMALQMALNEVALFYNHCRAHQNLQGRTPAEAWRGLSMADVAQTKSQATTMQALDGTIVGYHFRL